MFYESIEDLPIHCLMHLPREAQHVYRDAFNRAWKTTPVFRSAQMSAWNAVRQEFKKDHISGRWVQRSARKRGARVSSPAPRSHVTSST